MRHERELYAHTENTGNTENFIYLFFRCSLWPLCVSLSLFFSHGKPPCPDLQCDTNENSMLTRKTQGTQKILFTYSFGVLCGLCVCPYPYFSHTENLPVLICNATRTRTLCSHGKHREHRKFYLLILSVFSVASV